MWSNTYRIIVFFLLCYFAVFLAKSQINQRENGKFQKIDSLIEAAISQKAFPGAVLYVIHRDSVLFNKSYGYHTYDSLILTETSHIYDLASITKIAASTLALMKLYDEGCIDLDQPVKKYVKGFGWNKRGNVTLRESLTHQAGWRSWIPYYQDMKKKNGKWKKRFFSDKYSDRYPLKISEKLYLTKNHYKYIKRRIKRSKFDQEKGYEYSGLIFYLIPEIVSNLTGKSFEQFLDEFFYVPMNLNSMGFLPLRDHSLLEIPPTEIDTFFRKEKLHGVVHDEGAVLMGGISGNAGLFSSASDLGRLMYMLMNYGKLDTIQYFKPNTVQLFTTAQYPNNRRGLGFDKPLLRYDSLKSSTAKSVSFKSFGHTGYTGTMAWADPDYDLVFIFLCNRVYPSRENRKLYELSVRPQLQQLIYDYLNE